MPKDKTAKPSHSVGSLLADVQEFLSYKSQAAMLKNRAEKARDALASLVSKKGEYDEKGNAWLELPEPITAVMFNEKTGEYQEKTFSRLKRQRNSSVVVDEDAAMNLLEELDLVDEGTYTVTYVDHNKLYALQQEGKITETQLRDLFSEKETFSFVPVA